MAEALKPVTIYLYIIDTGPPFSKANWKVIANDSYKARIITPKLKTEERLIYLYMVSLARSC